MALSQTVTITSEFNSGNGYTIDASGWDTTVWHFVNPSGTISITASNDGGEINGVTQGNSLSALNFVAVQGTKLGDGTAVTAVAAAGLFRVGVVGRYVRMGGSGATADKVIIEFSKIS
jgi:hypothetical protein